MAPKDKKEQVEQAEEMTLAEARAYRLSKYKPQAPVLSEQEKRDQFKLFWARERAKYGKERALEEIVWLHLKSTKQDSPEQFESGLAHFGLKKIK